MRRLGGTSLVLLVVLAVPGNGLELRGELGTKLLWGEAHELVLRDGSYDDLISRLDWDIPPSLGLEVGITALWAPWTSTEVRLSLAFPLTSGSMVDQDWDADSLKYGRSEHTALLAAHWTADVSHWVSTQGWSAGVGLNYRYTSWEAWNGSGTYEYTDGTSKEVTFSGLGLVYRQQWVVPYLGLGWTSGPEGNLRVSPRVLFGPFSYCYDMDNHLARDPVRTFLDDSWGGLYGKASLEAEFPTGTRWTWGVRPEAALHWGAKGTTWVADTGASTGGVTYPAWEAEEKPGAWFWEASLTVFVRN